MPGVEEFESSMVELYRRQASVLPPGTEWFDAHTHIGFNDPDGFRASAEDILAGLEPRRSKCSPGPRRFSAGPCACRW